LFCSVVCAHGNPLSVIVAACTMTRRRSLACFGHYVVICGWPLRFEDKKGPTQLVFLIFYWPTIKSVGDRGMMGLQSGRQEQLFDGFRLDDWVPAPNATNS
jgi:hypothetical protein